MAPQVRTSPEHVDGDTAEIDGHEMVPVSCLSLSSASTEQGAHAQIVSMLQSSCEASGAEYALFWSICNGRLCVAAAWSKYPCGNSFVAESCTLMMEPGAGAVGRAFNEQNHAFIEDVCCLSADTFLRLELAKKCKVQSLFVFPWRCYGVLEFGAHGSWQVPPNFIPAFTGNLLPIASLSGGTTPTSVWEAVLWKRSRYLRLWRRRLLKLVDLGDCWHLSSWDVPNGSITGIWKLSRSLPYIKISPMSGFSATMQLSDLVLAADSTKGAGAMEELATILNGSFMRHGHSHSSAFSKEVALKVVHNSPRSRTNSGDSDCQSIDIIFDCPQCENCGMDTAKGRLVVQPVNDQEIGRWLCKRCFIAVWLPTCDGGTDGRLQRRPQWMSLTGSGALIDSTPPRTKRYSRVS